MKRKTTEARERRELALHEWVLVTLGATPADGAAHAMLTIELQKRGLL